MSHGYIDIYVYVVICINLENNGHALETLQIMSMPPLSIEKYFHLFWSIETNILKVQLNVFLFCFCYRFMWSIWEDWNTCLSQYFLHFVLINFRTVLFVLSLLLRSPPLFRFIFVLSLCLLDQESFFITIFLDHWKKKRTNILKVCVFKPAGVLVLSRSVSFFIDSL